MDLVTNEFCHQWKWSQWFFWMVDLVTHTFFNLWNWSHDFFSIVAYSILTFFSCDLFHPYKSVYGNYHKNMSNSIVTEKKLWLFPPLQKPVWLIPQLAVVTNSICPKRLCLTELFNLLPTPMQYPCSSCNLLNILLFCGGKKAP